MTIREMDKYIAKTNRFLGDFGVYFFVFSRFERAVTDLITWMSFTNRSETEKRQKLFMRLVRRKFLRKRVEILDDMLKTKHEDMYNKHSNIVEELRDVIKFRNSLVHSPVEFRGT